jgi:SAM-dependent methyltransferase
VSPDYIVLAKEDLSASHRFLQTGGKSAAFDQWHALMAAHGITRGRLLDIGCGIGGFLDFAAAHEFDAYGFDASTAQAEDARLRHPRVRAATCIADYESSLNEALLPFDAITLWDVFEHVRDPDALLTEIRNRLASAGLLFLSVPGGGLIPLKVALARLRGRPPGLIPWEHVFYHVPSSLRRVLEDNGFMVLVAGGVVPYMRAPGLAETIRQQIHRGLANSRLALQLFAIATPSS